jgi:hypothetical protein
MKKLIIPGLWVIAGAGFLVGGAVKPLAKGEPINYSLLTMAIVFFTFAAAFFAIGRKPAG